MHPLLFARAGSDIAGVLAAVIEAHKDQQTPTSTDTLNARPVAVPGHEQTAFHELVAEVEIGRVSHGQQPKPMTRDDQRRKTSTQPLLGIPTRPPQYERSNPEATT